MGFGDDYNPVIRWIHISDLHMRTDGADLFNIEQVLQRLLEDIKKFNPHFVLFSGDISFTGHNKEFNFAEKKFFNYLKKIEYLKENRIFICNGNHDIDRELLSYLQKPQINNQNELTEFYQQSGDFKILLSAQSSYINFSRHFNKNFKQDENFPLYYTYEFKIKNKTISVTSLSTATFSNLNSNSTAREPDYGELSIGEYQIVEALNKRSSKTNDLALVLTHHPIDFLTDWDRRITTDYFSKYYDFHFFGHSHYQRFEKRIKQFNQINSIQSGAIFSNNDDENVYTQLTWSLNDDKINILEREFDKSNLEWRNYDDSFVLSLREANDHKKVLVAKPLKLENYDIVQTDEFKNDLTLLNLTYEEVLNKLQKAFDNHINYFRKDYEKTPIPIDLSLYLLISKTLNIIEFHQLISCNAKNLKKISQWNTIIDTYRKLTYFSYRLPEKQNNISQVEFQAVCKWHKILIDKVNKYFFEYEQIDFSKSDNQSEIVRLIKAHLEIALTKINENKYLFKKKRDFSPDQINSEIISNFETSLMHMHKIISSFYPDSSDKMKTSNF